MRQKYGHIQAMGATVLAVSFEPRDRLFQLSRILQLPFPLLSDPEMDVYRAYGLKRGDLRHIFSPRTILTYVKLLAQSRMYQFRRSDLRQLGGDLVIDPEGVVRYQYLSTTPNDRPSVADLISNIQAP